MSLKTKLVLGLGFLFLIIFALAGFCSYYVGSLGWESENILKDNYNSIVYSRNMLSGLDNMKTAIIGVTHNTGRIGMMSDYYDRLFESGKNTLDANLKAENNNITEIHEREYVETLKQDYDSFLKLSLQLKGGQIKSSAYLSQFLSICEKLKQSINSIYDINMQAVVRKSNLAKHDSERFINFMAIIGSFCILLAVGYFWYFPVYVSTTLCYLSERMRNLLKNIGVTFDLNINDEAYLMLHAIGLLENRLSVKKEDTRST
jgi:two-component system, NtrC family, sensor histidine kinase KinB